MEKFGSRMKACDVQSYVSAKFPDVLHSCSLYLSLSSPPTACLAQAEDQFSGALGDRGFGL